jgi:hypothetical protein
LQHPLFADYHNDVTAGGSLEAAQEWAPHRAGDYNNDGLLDLCSLARSLCETSSI